LFDDAIITPLKMAEVLDKSEKTLGQLVDELPIYPTIREEIKCPDEIKSDVIVGLTNDFLKEFKETSVLDGIRVTLDDGWVLIRQSNTSPIIRLTAEAKNQESLNRIKTEFMHRLQEKIDEIKNL